MMKRFLPLALAALLVVACGKDKKENEEPVITKTEEVAPLTFEKKYYQETSTIPCKEDCPIVKIEVPEAGGNKKAARVINDSVFSKVRELIYFGEKPYNATTYNELMKSFMQSYEELKKEFPEETTEWEGTVKGDVSYRSDAVLNISLSSYTYTGGAHGNQGDYSLLFDPNNGKPLEYRDLFNDVNGFTDYAEKKFRQEFKISEMAPINDGGLMFEGENFALPNNIFFEEDGLLLFYNTYEISSYADGPKKLKLPYNDIKEYLKVK